jgi:hypothetical protein
MSCGLHKDAGLRKIINHHIIIVHAPIIEFGNSVIRKRNVILMSVAFLKFLLRKRKILGRTYVPHFPPHDEAGKNHTVRFHEIQPPNNYVQNFHFYRISVICQKEPPSFASFAMYVTAFINVHKCITREFQVHVFYISMHNLARPGPKVIIAKAKYTTNTIYITTNDVYTSDCIGHTQLHVRKP